MSLRSVTVFVRQLGATYHASMYQSDSVSRASADDAARICAGRFFGVEPGRIQLIRQKAGNDQVLIASVAPEPPLRYYPLSGALVSLGITAVAMLILLLALGGGR